MKKDEEPQVFVEEGKTRAQPDFSYYEAKYEEEKSEGEEEFIDIEGAEITENQREMSREEVYYSDPFLYRQKYAKDFDIQGLQSEE